VLAGSIRFAIEFVRVNEPLVGPFTLAHLISAAVTIAGIALLANRGRSPS
jgi:prolipoprotein diacylglyceryltransferase